MEMGQARAHGIGTGKSVCSKKFTGRKAAILSSDDGQHKAVREGKRRAFVTLFAAWSAPLAGTVKIL
jgi:hypothetical protein